MDLDNFLLDYKLTHLKQLFKAENIDLELLVEAYDEIIPEFGNKLKIGDRLSLKRAVSKYKENKGVSLDQKASGLRQTQANVVHVPQEVQLKFDSTTSSGLPIYYVQEYPQAESTGNSSPVYTSGVTIAQQDSLAYSQVVSDLNLTDKTPADNVNPEKDYLPNWKRYGQLRPFPKIYHLPEFSYNQKIWLENNRTMDAKERKKALRDLASALVSQFKTYFIWEMPSYLLRIACHKLIETYPHLIDDSVTGYDKVYGYVINKYRVVRRKLTDSAGIPQWIQQRKTPVYTKRKRSDEAIIEQSN